MNDTSLQILNRYQPEITRRIKHQNSDKLKILQKSVCVNVVPFSPSSWCFFTIFYLIHLSYKPCSSSALAAAFRCVRVYWVDKRILD